ncbi:hypothetical protein NE261_01190 [Enterococcus italicus]|uniref:hypothetical protein n=1 Tax=Enterococcus italicus TaxID=246144 RepID=UPI0020731413|nr:hypothetical protein [Enterococcus italicus]MCM6930432.1 hypothetical protein [Enterococcus italicus]
MSVEKETRSLFTDGLAVGIGIGLFSGIVSTIWAKKRSNQSADEVLDEVKLAFLKEGPIEGSWIQFQKQPFRKFAIRTEVYAGGISRIEDQTLVTYEFLADAGTGTVLEVHRIPVEQNDSVLGF